MAATARGPGSRSRNLRRPAAPSGGRAPRSRARAPARELGVVDERVDAPTGDIETDLIAIANESERAAERGLGRDVEDDGAERRAAHPRVRDPDHVLDALFRQLLRDRQVAGFGHSRRAERAGIAQHEDVVGRDVEVRGIDARGEIVERVEDDGAAGVLQQARRRRRLLDDRAARRQVAAQHGHAAARADRVGTRPDHVLRVARVHLREALAERGSGDVARAEVEQVSQLVEQARHAAGPVEVLHVVAPGRLEVDQDRHLAAERVDLVEVDRDAEPAGGGSEVDQRVGRAADRLQNDEGVAERRARHHLARQQTATLGHRHRGLAARLGRAQAVGVRRRDRRRRRQREPHRLGDARHRARRSHHHARPRRRRQSRVDGLDLGGVDAAAAEVAPQAPAVGAGAERLAAVMADEHRPDRNDDRRQVGRRRRHHLRGNRLVAAADQDHGVHRLGADHLLGVHRHQVAQEHARRMRERLVDRDRRKLHRQAAGEHHAALDRGDDLRHVAVAGVVVAEGVGDADDRPREGVVRQPHRLDERLAQEERELGVAVRRQALLHSLRRSHADHHTVATASDHAARSS
jgi:hypothetical protein